MKDEILIEILEGREKFRFKNDTDDPTGYILLEELNAKEGKFIRADKVRHYVKHKDTVKEVLFVEYLQLAAMERMQPRQYIRYKDKPENWTEHNFISKKGEISRLITYFFCDGIEQGFTSSASDVINTSTKGRSWGENFKSILYPPLPTTNETEKV